MRISGNHLDSLITALLQRTPQPRLALYTPFHAANGTAIDHGIAIHFPAPHSYTGDDVLELHCHGNPLLTQQLIQRALELGARLAEPGEFTQRAFLNGKLDLVQAEAIADLIDGTTALAIRAAQRSLAGCFSEQINSMAQSLIELRVQVEAGLDFSDEDIAVLDYEPIEQRIDQILDQQRVLLRQTRQGAILRDGYSVVLAGKPNSGKSSLLNCLSGKDSAIVTDIPGTTRDVLREPIQIDGMPLHIIDTAGLRQTEHPIESEGIRRAQVEMANADRILIVMDASMAGSNYDDIKLPTNIPTSRVHNKIDLTEIKPGISRTDNETDIYVSAKTGAGIEELREHLKQAAGFQAEADDLFIARRRHLNALQTCENYLIEAKAQCRNHGEELLAECLRLAQEALGEITGKVTADDMLGHIFSTFCVGK